MCAFNKGDAVYFLGGEVGSVRSGTCLRDAYRYDISTKNFQKIPDMKEARSSAHGAAAHGKICVIGGLGSPYDDIFTKPDFKRRCEVYSETTDEW